MAVQSDDRDRVTAIAACDYEHGREGQVCHCHAERVPELLAALLEALDTIDKARELHQRGTKVTSWPDDPADYCGCGAEWPCATWQALNGGNESGDDR